MVVHATYCGEQLDGWRYHLVQVSTSASATLYLDVARLGVTGPPASARAVTKRFDTDAAIWRVQLQLADFANFVSPSRKAVVTSTIRLRHDTRLRQRHDKELTC